jgi:hypothetical protein
VLAQDEARRQALLLLLLLLPAHQAAEYCEGDVVGDTIGQPTAFAGK